MPIAATVVPSARSRVDPRRAGRQVDRDHLGPLEVAAAVAVDHDQPLGLGDHPGADQREQRGQNASSPSAITVPRWNGVIASRVSASKVTQSEQRHHDQHAADDGAGDPRPERAPGVRQRDGGGVAVRAGRHGCR